MMDPLPDLDDLAALFESEPVYPFGIADSPWPYVCVRFAVARGAVRAEIEVEPASDQVSLALRSAGQQLVHLELHAVRSVMVERRHGIELLGVVFDEGLSADGLWLRTAPEVSLTWRAGADE